VGLSQKKTQ